MFNIFAPFLKLIDAIHQQVQVDLVFPFQRDQPHLSHVPVLSRELAVKQGKQKRSLLHAGHLIHARTLALGRLSDSAPGRRDYSTKLSASIGFFSTDVCCSGSGTLDRMGGGAFSSPMLIIAATFFSATSARLVCVAISSVAFFSKFCNSSI